MVHVRVQMGHKCSRKRRSAPKKDFCCLKKKLDPPKQFNPFCFSFKECKTAKQWPSIESLLLCSLHLRFRTIEWRRVAYHSKSWIGWGRWIPLRNGSFSIRERLQIFLQYDAFKLYIWVMTVPQPQRSLSLLLDDHFLGILPMKGISFGNITKNKLTTSSVVFWWLWHIFTWRYAH